MMAPWRPLAFVAALNVTVLVGVATGQTVIVTNAPPGSAVEVALNAATIGTATADAGGLATLAVNMPGLSEKGEAQAHFFVDVCDKLRRVVLVEPGLQPLPQAPCARREIAGVYLVRSVTTFVVNVGEPEPTVRLRQGPAPPQWLSGEVERDRGAAPAFPLPTGLAAFGGGGLGKSSNASTEACGNAPACTGDDMRLALNGGVAFWITPFLAAEGRYVRPAEFTARGSGTGYSFSSSQSTNVLTIAARAGLPAGRIRPYGFAGANYHRAAITTSQTMEDTTVTVDGNPITIKGGTQTWVLNTGGWGWLFGGGLEIWLTPSFGLYGDVLFASLRGSNRDGGEGSLKDRLTVMTGGATFRIGRSFRK